MGLVVALAWVIIGACYIAYKFYSEELRMTPRKALFLIVLGFGAFFLLGALAGGIDWLEENAPILFALVTLPPLIALIALLVWLIAGDVKEQTKDTPATGSIAQGINGEITREHLYTLRQQPPSEDMEYLSKIRTIQKNWFESHDVYLSFGEAVAQLRSLGGKVAIDPSVRWREQKPKGFSASTESIEFSEWVRLYGADTRDEAERVAALTEKELQEAELLAMSPVKYIHFRDRVGEQVLRRMVSYAQKNKGGIEKEEA